MMLREQCFQVSSSYISLYRGRNFLNAVAEHSFHCIFLLCLPSVAPTRVPLIKMGRMVP